MWVYVVTATNPSALRTLSECCDALEDRRELPAELKLLVEGAAGTGDEGVIVVHDLCQCAADIASLLYAEAASETRDKIAEADKIARDDRQAAVEIGGYLT